MNAPTDKEIKEYADSIGFKSLDIQAFRRYYSPDGGTWKLGSGKPVKCWKKCVCTWYSKVPKVVDDYECTEDEARRLIESL